MTNYIINVSAVIFDGEKRVLLGHRSPNEDVFPGLWCIPGGKIDDGDASLEDGLCREVKEEVGIEIREIELINNNTRIKSDGTHILYLIFKALIASGSPKPLEDTTEVKWFNFEEIKSDNLTPFTYEVIKKALT